MSKCIEWEGSRNEKNYGMVFIKRRKFYAHRIAYCKAHNIDIESIKGKVVRHTCDNPPCVNPDHLILGTQADNVADMISRNRQATGEELRPRYGELNHNAKLTDQQVDEIRARYVRGCRENGIKALSRDYATPRSTIFDIVKMRKRTRRASK